MFAFGHAKACVTTSRGQTIMVGPRPKGTTVPVTRRPFGSLGHCRGILPASRLDVGLMALCPRPPWFSALRAALCRFSR